MRIRNRIVYGKHAAIKMSRKRTPVCPLVVTEDDHFEDIEETIDLTQKVSSSATDSISDTVNKGLCVSRKRKRSQGSYSSLLENKMRGDSSRPSLRQSDLSKLHSCIDKTNVTAMFDPIGDGNCGYRAISYLHYGNEDRYKEVKRDMLVGLEANKDKYVRFFGFDIASIEENIRSDMDESKKSMALWFCYPECIQVAVDTYDIPICFYGDATCTRRMNEAITMLPIRAPVKPKLKVMPYHIQNVGSAHWIAVQFGHRRMQYPDANNMYFHVHESYVELFKTTWDFFGQFPKHREGESFDAEKHELLTVGSSDEEQFFLNIHFFFLYFTNLFFTYTFYFYFKTSLSTFLGL
ncbi:hypothetical protein HPULCUR_006364 [Helicostylum pulchrum]|uniref:Uncharacterized protein n=1 Tax=Helicostylum pulchrum TaxID=562976 RepID=A0ABP9Y1P7_9FUNG